VCVGVWVCVWVCVCVCVGGCVYVSTICSTPRKLLRGGCSRCVCKSGGANVWMCGCMGVFVCVCVCLCV